MKLIFLVSGHSSYDRNAPFIKVPEGLVFTPTVSCGRTGNRAKNMALSRHFKNNSSTRDYLKTQTLFKAGDFVRDVTVTMRPMSNYDTSFHGLMRLPLKEGQHLLKQNREAGMYGSTLKLSQIFLLMKLKHDTQNPTSTYYIIGNYCARIQGMHIDDIHKVVRFDVDDQEVILKAHEGQSVNNLLQTTLAKETRKAKKSRILGESILDILRFYTKEKTNKKPNVPVAISNAVLQIGKNKLPYMTGLNNTNEAVSRRLVALNMNLARQRLHANIRKRGQKPNSPI